MTKVPRGLYGNGTGLGHPARPSTEERVRFGDQGDPVKPPFSGPVGERLAAVTRRALRGGGR